LHMGILDQAAARSITSPVPCPYLDPAPAHGKGFCRVKQLVLGDRHDPRVFAAIGMGLSVHNATIRRVHPLVEAN
jgi:hypothetical protein